jgi:hypothetical protein
MHYSFLNDEISSILRLLFEYAIKNNSVDPEYLLLLLPTLIVVVMPLLVRCHVTDVC